MIKSEITISIQTYTKTGDKMNIGKSVKVAMAQKELSINDVVVGLGISYPQVSVYRKKPIQSGAIIQRLADYFEMSVSEFVALGE